MFESLILLWEALSAVQVLTIAVTALSMVYQQKLARDARRAQDAAKGLSVPTEGEVKAIPVCYGRNIVGGIRVFHNTANNYKHADAPTAVQFFSGSPYETSTPETVHSYNGPQTVNRTLPPTALVADTAGSKHEYMFIQQALCFGKIHNIIDVAIDPDRYFDHPDLNVGMRVNAYKDGGVADPMVAANFPERAAAYFNSMSYLSMVFKLNRDAPQFSGPPVVRALVEGLEVFTIVRSGTIGAYTYALSAAKVYSNNPAYCLLDYLTSPMYGKGMLVADIDLESFYNSAQVCDTIVQTNVNAQGRIWVPTSTGKYTVAYSEPNYCDWLNEHGAWTSNKKDLTFDRTFSVEIKVAGVHTFTSSADNSGFIYLDGSSTPLVTVRGFTTTYTGTASLSVGTHTVRVVGNNTGGPGAIGLTIDSTTETVFDLRTPVTGVPRDLKLYECNISLDAEDSLRDNVSKIKDTMQGAELVWSGGQYKLLLQYPVDIAHIQLAATITDDDLVRESLQIKWPSAAERYNFCIVKYANEALDFKDDSVSWPPKTGPVYAAMLAEDNNVKLEADFYDPGIKDYYHALARAEHRVRLSRVSAVYSFSIRFKGLIFEPGDHLKIESTVMNIPGEYVIVQEAKMNNDGSVSITSVRTRPEVFAWNAKDDEYVIPAPIYGSTLYTPSLVAYDGTSVTWSDRADTAATNYSIYYWYGGSTFDGATDIVPAGELTADHTALVKLHQVYRVLTQTAPSMKLVKDWLTALTPANSGSILAAITNSMTLPAVAALYPPSDSNVVFVDKVYVALTGGSSDPDGKAYWVDKLVGGMTRPQMIDAMLNLPQVYNSNFKYYGESNQKSLAFNVVNEGVYAFAVLGKNNAGMKSDMGFSAELYKIAPTVGVSTSVATIEIYIRSATVPATPTGGSFDFSTTTLSSVPAGCSVTIPAGTDPLYVSTAIVSAVYPSTVDSVITWNTFRLLSGVDGAAAKYVVLSNDAQLFARNDAGATYAPSSINLSISAYNFTPTTWLWEYWNGAIWLAAGSSTSALIVSSGGFTGYRTFRCTVNSLYRDEITLGHITGGTNAVTIVLSNESHVLPSDGVTVDYTGSGTDVQVWIGNTQLTAVASPATAANTFSIVPTATSITAGAVSRPTSLINRIAQSSAITANIASISIAITVRDANNIATVYTKTQSITKATSGTSAAYVIVTNNSQIFSRTDSGAAYVPASVNLNASAYGITVTAWAWQYWNGSVWTAIAGASGTVAPISQLNILSSAFTDSRRYRCLVNSIYSDEVTLVHMTGGSSAVTIVLSNEAVSFPASSTGVVSAGSYTGSGTDIRVWIGNTQLNVGASNSQFSISAVGTSITVGSQSTVSLNTARFAAASAMLDAQATAYITFTITVKDANGVATVYTKIQSFSKANAGTNGADGANGANGAAGARGSIEAVAYDQAVYAYPGRLLGKAKWSATRVTNTTSTAIAEGAGYALGADTLATTALCTKLGLSSSTNYLQFGDKVTFVNKPNLTGTAQLANTLLGTVVGTCKRGDTGAVWIVTTTNIYTNDPTTDTYTAGVMTGTTYTPSLVADPNAASNTNSVVVIESTPYLLKANGNVTVFPGSSAASFVTGLTSAKGLAYGGLPTGQKYYVAAGSLTAGVGLRYSATGAAWTTVSGLSGVLAFSAITFSEGLFVAAATDASNNLRFYSSIDGKTWSEAANFFATGVTPGVVTGLARGNGVWLAVTDTARSFYSETSTTWTQGSDPLFASAACHRLIFDQQFVVVGGASKASVSYDGKTWTTYINTAILPTLTTTNNFTGLMSDGYTLSMVDTSGRVVRSFWSPIVSISGIWSGTVWLSNANVIDGSLIVKGTIASESIDTRGLTIKDASGNIILSSGGLSPTYIRDLTVDTLKIANNAVTQSIGANGPLYYLTPDDNWQSVLSIPGVVLSGAKVFTLVGGLAIHGIKLGGNSTSDIVDFRINYTGTTSGSVTNNIQMSTQYIAAGTYTFTLQVKYASTLYHTSADQDGVYGWRGKYQYPALFIMETKK